MRRSPVTIPPEPLGRETVCEVPLIQCPPEESSMDGKDLADAGVESQMKDTKRDAMTAPARTRTRSFKSDLPDLG
jgi:hypothetical protein